ncbi:MAG: TonB-dependent receptor [Halioglobus sp.]
MQQRDIRRHFISLVLGALQALAPNLLWSAEEKGSSATGALEEIIVTARRRDESTVNVPMSLTRLDGAILDNLQYRNIDEFLSLSPGVLVYPGGDGVSPQITIRGVVTPGEFVEPGNAVYVDEVYSSGMRTVLPGFYDIESVQVLKGPQAGLYGRNTTGGAVLVTTGQPTDELFARIDASRAQYDAREMDGTVNVPLSDALRLRATGWYNKEDGGYYEDNVIGESLDASREEGGRLTVAALPNERITLTLTGEYDRIRPSTFGGIVEGALLGPSPLAPESRHNVLRDDVGDSKQDTSRINGKLYVDLDSGSIVAVAGWRKVAARASASDFDGTAYSASYSDFLADPSKPYAIRAPQVVAGDDRDTSQNAELRYLTPDESGRLRAQVGVSYFEENTRLFGQVYPVRDFAQILAAIGQNGCLTRSTDQDSTSWAGFTELIWTPMPTIEITTDLRYTRDHKHIDSLLAETGYYARNDWSDIALDTSDTFEKWSPGITLAYKPDTMLTVFAKYVQGFRAGGFNTLVNSPALQTYDSEEAENYELGFKSLLLDQRLEVGASVFYLRINNALVPQPDPGDLETFYPLQNPGTVETTGLEVDLAAQASSDLSLTASGVPTTTVSPMVAWWVGINAPMCPITPQAWSRITSIP